MDALRRKAVVREIDIFSSLFPRSFSPQHQTETLSVSVPAVDDDNARQQTTRMPKLGMISPKTPKSLMASLPMTATDCAVVWKFLCDWVTAQTAMEAPATIPGLGTVTMRTQALKIRMAFFDPDPLLMEKNGLHVEGKEVKAPQTLLARTPSPLTETTGVLVFSFLEMASCCGKHVEPAKAKEWLETLVRRLGDTMRQCQRVEFDLAVGVVVCSNKVIDTHMLPRHTSVETTVPFEIRTGESVVKRSLLSSAAVKPSKPTLFLTSANFSPGIRLNPAIAKDKSGIADLFAFDGSASPRFHHGKNRVLTAMIPNSPSATGTGYSPRTQRLLKRPQTLCNSQPEQQIPSTIASASFPVLFDSISRTYCVEPDLNLATIQPSNRIASNYTPAAAGLLMVRASTDTSRLGPSHGTTLLFAAVALPYDSPFDAGGGQTTRIASADSDIISPERAASEEKYFAYLNEANQLMNQLWLAPLAPSLVDRIVASAVKYLNDVPTGHMKRVLEAAQQEFTTSYNISVKKAIMDYLLLRRASRERLGITHGTPAHTELPYRWQWGDSKGANGCLQDLKSLAASCTIVSRPLSPMDYAPRRGQVQRDVAPSTESSLVIKKRRRRRIKLRLQATFMLCDTQIRALHYMWYDFQASLSLVKLPNALRLSEKLDPVQIHVFEKEQLAHATQMRAYLMEYWYHRTKQMFEAAVVKLQRELSPFATLDIGKLRHLFDAIAVQMSLQIRSLLLKSIREYVSFFEMFGTPPVTARDIGDCDESPRLSALLVSLTLRNGEIQFKTPLVEIPSMLLGVLHNLPQLFHNISRIENQFETSLVPLFNAAIAAVPGNTGQRYTPFLWNVTSQEEEIVVATMRIREIIERNMTQLHALVAKYALFSSTFREIMTAESGGDDTSSDGDGFEQWRKQLEQVRVVARSLVVSTRSCVHLNLFSVSCQQVNHQFLSGFAQWIHGLLKGFAERTAAFNAQLRQQYKDVAARLAKRPLDLYDLVEAEAFVEQLKHSKLKELQLKVDDIKQRMQFLLLQRESIHVDGVDANSTDTSASPPRKEPKTTAASLKGFTVSQELLASTAKTIRWRTHIERLLQDAEASLVGERARIEAVFLAKRNRFHAEIEEFNVEVKSFSKKGDLRHAATYVVQLSKMKDVLAGFKRQMESIVDEEAKLQWKQTDFCELDDIAEEMEPYEQLWTTARQFRELNSRWLRTNVFELQAHEGLKSLQQMMVTISTVSNQLHLNLAAAAITAEMIKKQMSDFRENTKLVAAILNPSVQERHLKKISTLLALTIDPQEPITLLQLLENGVYDHLPRIVAISENATIEKQIEDALRTILIEWHGVQFRFNDTAAPQSTSGDAPPPSLIKSSVEEIKLLVEDHQLRLQALQCLTHAQPFSREINDCLDFLRDTFTIVDLLVATKTLWKRIAPLFNAKIIENAAEESKLFTVADRLFRSCTWTVALQPICLQLVPRAAATTASEVHATLKTNDAAASYEIARSVIVQLLADLRQCHDLLERVKANVSVGFESRRMQFPRFFLLSDYELVAVLALRSSNQPIETTEAVVADAASPELWRYLSLCFPGVQRVHVNASSPTQDLAGFLSAHGELVPIGTSIPTADVPLVTWLSKFESVMITILQACTRTAISDFARKEFRKWCLLWPEQVLCTTIQYAWTMQGEINNKKLTLSEAKAAWQAEIQVLNDRVDAVTRELKAAATPGMRLSLANVILQLQHLRTVSMAIVDEIAALPDEQQPTLAEKMPSQLSEHQTAPPPSDFSSRETMTWLSQPRVYYDSMSALGIKMLSYTPIPYGFEYVGNAAPTVCVTPLTLRCFHAMAFHANTLMKGSIVHGPARSGKKTTFASLARLCGRLLIHFDHQDHSHMGSAERFHGLVQFIKATVACGAWLMVSGIQHLHPIAYASKLASTCSHIMDSQAAKHTQCTVLDTKIKLKKGIQFLIVAPPIAHSAPTGGSRGSLDYLRAFFRPIHVMTHDAELFAEFFLEQHKMMHTKSLAKLIVTITRVISGEIDLLEERRGLLRDRFLSVGMLRNAVVRSARMCAQERVAVCSAHGWPPQSATAGLLALAPSPTVVEKEMSAELVRDLERMEIKAVCLTLHDLIGKISPASMGEWLDQFIRDFLPNSRELQAMRSFVGQVSASRDKSSGGLSGQTPATTVEEAIERLIRLNAGITGGWGYETLGVGQISPFVQKIVQFHHALKSSRVTVVVGDTQSGKSAVWATLAASLSQVHLESTAVGTTQLAPGNSDDLVCPTHTIVLHPRALSLAQMFGTSLPGASHSSDNETVLTRVLRDAKKRARASGEQPSQTWLVLDGDIHAAWADAMLQLAESPTDESESISRLPGLLPPSQGRRLAMPAAMRLIFETTTLDDISPSFLACVGVVHVGGLGTPDRSSPDSTARGFSWRQLYRMWKAVRRDSFAPLEDELFTVLDTLVDETLDASLEFVVSHFSPKSRSRSSSISQSSIMSRVCSFLALLHSFLLQSWAKINVMVSGKQRKTAVHGYFLQALVWGIGHTSDATERHKFHTFLTQWIINGPRSADSSLKRVLILFFPSGMMGITPVGKLGMGVTQRNLDINPSASSVANKETMYNYAFSVELGPKWMRWPGFYDAWIEDRCQFGGGDNLAATGASDRSTPGSDATANSEQGVDAAHSGASARRLDALFVRTPNMCAAVFLLHHLMASGYSGLLCGPRDASKSTSGRAWVELHALFSQLQNASAAARAGTIQDEASGGGGHGIPPVPSECVYIGDSVKARHLLEQLSPFIEPRRVKVGRERQGQDPLPFSITSSTLVFIDDLHRASPYDPNDSALELLRGLIEHEQLVHPTANIVIPCDGGLTPFAAIQDDGAGRPFEPPLHRLMARFIPIGLTPCSDTELSTICSVFVNAVGISGIPSTSSSESGSLVSSDPSYSLAAQEAHQLVAMLIKATIKLYRTISSDHWSISPPDHFSSSDRAHAANIAFQPAKALYLFHLHDVFRVLQSVFGDTRQTLAMAEKLQVAKLWCHESARILGDRLRDENDTQAFYNVLYDVACSHFNLAAEAFVAAGSVDGNNTKQATISWLKNQLHFSFIGESSGAGMADGYREVHELHKIELSIERTMMAMYRANIVTESIPLVLCNYAIHHVLKLTRVLRLVDQHLLLVGAQGNKMRTLTHLAACICRRTMSTFYVPRSSQDAMKTWTTALKKVLLQCMRQPRDERHVFIVKDMWLENLEIYEAVDRYLSGSKLLSDMITYEDFDMTVLQTLRDEAERERRAGAHDLTVSMHSKSSVVEYFFTQVRRRLQLVVILCLPPDPPSCAPPTDPSCKGRKLANFVWQYPHIQKRCTVQWFGEWPEESLHVIAQKCFSPMFGTDRDRLLQLSQVSVQMYTSTRLVWPRWAKGEDDSGTQSSARPRTRDGKTVHEVQSTNELVRPSVLMPMDPSMLIEQISLFLAHWPRLQHEVETNKAKYAAGLEFIERTEQILALEQTQQQLLEPEMVKKSALTRRMSGNLEKHRLAATRLNKALEMETALVESQRARLAQVEREYDELIHDTQAEFEAATAKMETYRAAVAEHGADDGTTLAFMDDQQQSDINTTGNEDSNSSEGEATSSSSSDPKHAAILRQRRGMIQSFVNLPNPATSLRQLAECVGLIFGIEPVEARDDLDPDEIVMDYWGSATTVMQTPQFWDALVEFDVRKRMTETVVACVLPICAAPEFEWSLFAGIHEFAALLCEWVQACANYAKDVVLAEPKCAQLCQERTAFVAAVAQLQKRQAEIHVQAKTTSQVTAMRTLTEQARREIEDKLKDNTSMLQMTTSVWKVLEPCRAKWRHHYEYYTQFTVQAMGDLMLATASMVYASSTAHRVRRRLCSLWSDILNRHHVMHSHQGNTSFRRLDEVYLVDDRALTRWQIDGLPRQDPVAVESAVMVAQSYLFPVLIDPHGVGTAWLKRQCARSGNDSGDDKEMNATVVSGSTCEFDALWESITQGVRKKRPVIVEDLTEEVAAELQCLVQSKRRARYDVVNRDVSSIASSAGISSVNKIVTRQMSSVGGGLGVADESSGFGPSGNHRCWFQVSSCHAVPTNRFDKPTIVECGSESCRVYFVYSASEVIPDWLASLASQVAIIRFDFSTTHVREKALRVLVDAQGAAKSHVLMKVQTLQFDLIACDEQIETIENEILDFFSVEEPLTVYSDNAKALKIVGNRSALHALESSKLDSTKKIQRHYLRLSSYGGLVRRCLDHVLTWRDLGAVDASSFPVEWIWMTLAQTAHESLTTAVKDNQQRLSTFLLRQVLQTACSTSIVPLLFDVLLSLRVNHRRRHRGAGPSSTDALTADTETLESQEEGDDDLEIPPPLHDVLPRIVQLRECKDDAEVKTLCVSVTSKLLTARPSDMIPIHKWRAVCYLAEAYTPLRDLITSQSVYGGKDGWKEALALDQLLEERPSRWSPRVDVDALSRLCFTAAWHKTHFYQELQEFVDEALSWPPAVVDESAPVMATQAEAVLTDQANNVSRLDSLIGNDVASSDQVAPLRSSASLSELWKKYSGISTCVVVINQPDCDVQTQIRPVIDAAKASVDFLDGDELSDQAFEKCVIAAIQKGLWIAIVNVETRPRWLPILSKLMAKIYMLEPHADFRLWISALDASPSLFNKIGTTQLVATQSTGFTFMEMLYDTLLRVVSDASSQPELPRVASLPDVVATATTTAPLWSQMLVRLCLLHATLMCQDQLDTAPWHTRDVSFSVEMLDAVVKILATLNNNDGVESSRIWREAKHVIRQTYGAALQTESELLLLDCCIELFFAERGSFDSETMDAAMRTIPQIAFVTRDMDGCGLNASLIRRVETSLRSTGTTCGVSDKRQTRILHERMLHLVCGLRRVLEYRGILSVAAQVKPGMSPSAPGRGGRAAANIPVITVVHHTTLVLDTLARFMVDLEGYEFDVAMLTERHPCEYKRPLNQLLHREVERVKSMQQQLAQEIKHLLAVAATEEAPCPSASEAIADLIRGDTPRSWMRDVSHTDSTLSERVPLDVFQLTVLERIQYFHSWIESGIPNRIAVDKFDASVDCILETIHHHLVRNLIGNVHCGGAHDCARIVEIYDDRPQISLTVRDDSFYLSGWSLHGHLQLEIRNTSPSTVQTASMVADLQRKRSQQLTRSMNETTVSEAALDGTPVIVEVSSRCLHSPPVNAAPMMTSGSTRQLLPPPSAASSAASSRRSSITPTTEFRCPVFTKIQCSKGGTKLTSYKSDTVREITTLCVSSSIPLPQLVFSGSSLHVNSLVVSHERL